MASHARLAPSSAPVWGYCSGSVIAAQAMPSAESEQSRNGTAAHWLAAHCLTEWKVGGTTDPRRLIGEVCPENGVVIDAQMAEGAAVYVDDVISTLTHIPGGRDALVVEFRVHMPRIHPDNWGTLDAAAVLPKSIFIWDYKHGHAKVKAEGNLQLANYLEGLCTDEGINILGYTIDGQLLRSTHPVVIARVVQPNAYDGKGPVDEWTFALPELEQYTARLWRQAQEVYTNPTLTSGAHCRYCSARGRCPALRDAVYNLIDIANAPLAFDDMTGADLATEREILKRGQTVLNARLEAVEDQLAHLVRGGDTSSGLALESVAGAAKWGVSPEQVVAVCSLMGLDVSRPHCDTPSQARAKLQPENRAAFDAAIKPLTKRKRTLKLVDRSDTTAARVFGKKQEN